MILSFRLPGWKILHDKFLNFKVSIVYVQVQFIVCIRGMDMVVYDRFQFFKKEKTIYRNLERSTLKLERNKSHPMFNELCYNNDILPTYTTIWVTELDNLKVPCHISDVLARRTINRIAMRPAPLDGPIDHIQTLMTGSP